MPQGSEDLYTNQRTRSFARQVGMAVNNEAHVTFSSYGHDMNETLPESGLVVHCCQQYRLYHAKRTPVEPA